jgi:hypothetical protein
MAAQKNLAIFDTFTIIATRPIHSVYRENSDDTP